MSIDPSKILHSISKFKMISMKLLRGALCLNPHVAAVANIGPISSSPRHDDKDDHMNHGVESRNLSISSHFNQAAPLLTPKAPKITAKLKETQMELPQRPKKPATAWISFLRDNKDKYLRERQMRADELTVLVSKEWQSANRTRYEQEYQRRHDEYRQALESYENSLTDEQKAVIKLRKNLKRESRAMKALRATKPPVLPRNPANMYCVERCKDHDIKELMRTKKSAHVLRDLFAEYRQLSDAEKEKYLDLQQKDKLRFQQEFNQWYDSIKSEANLSKTAHEKADLLHARFKALNWI